MSSDGSDDVPLAKKIKVMKIKVSKNEQSKLSVNSDCKTELSKSDKDDYVSSEYDDSDFDPTCIGQCDIENCKKEVFDICVYCELMFCLDHNKQHKPCYSKKKIKKDIRIARPGRKVCSKEKLQVSKECNANENGADHQQACEVYVCGGEVFAACHRCVILLCWPHFDNNDNCDDHKTIETPPQNPDHDPQDPKTFPSRPEDYTVEGGEDQHRPNKSPRKNKRKIAQQLRNEGKDYISPRTNKTVGRRTISDCCNLNTCTTLGKECYKINEEARLEVNRNFYELGNLQLQREFIVRHIESEETKQKTTNKLESRRQKSNKYFLTYNSERLTVCKKFFLTTLSISERTARTAMAKLTSTGVVQSDKRGGRRSQERIEQDDFNKKIIADHIARFPFVESHYCRSKTSRNYLHADLSIAKMYFMFKEENKDIPNLPSFSSYRRVFVSKNLSFHRPKKDQCSLCMTYLKGDEETKTKLKEQYETHCKEKEKVRKLKDSCKRLCEMEIEKNKAEPDEFKVKTLCASFDLQQVIHLPITKESALFYKRRLGVFNLTFYNIATKEVFCYTWDECQSKRGSSEISTAVYLALKHYDDQGIENVNLFSDGCPGQNKNSIIPTMLLYFVSQSKSVQEISLKFFEPYHGQNEGDSCHSAISYAVEKAGNIIIPSQLHPIFRLARRSDPYSVIPLQSCDFLDFKKLSKDLRILQEREVEEVEGTPSLVVDWTKMTELKVSKTKLKEIQFKTSHLQETYSKLQLKRQTGNISKMQVEKLNKKKVMIPKAKYEDLLSLCQGAIPVIRSEEHKQFFQQLPHQD